MNAKYMRIAFCATLLLTSIAAQAVPTITVNGFASGALAAPAPSGKTDTETGSPFARTVVSVADEAPGAWKYFALSDITTPKLQVFGSLDNSTGPALGGGEISLLLSNATLRDTITIEAPTADPYFVTAEMVIDGVLQGNGSDATVTAEFTMVPSGELGQSRFISYQGNDFADGDVLSIEHQFSGNAVFDLRSSLFFFVHQVDAGANVMADFSHTAIINIAVTTLGRDPIENFTLSSGSGSFGVAPVPAPAALPLMLGGVMVLSCRRRRLKT